MYQLSPFVWSVDGGYEILVRAVPKRDDDPSKKIACIYHGRSRDGLTFTMDEAPVIAPGPQIEDRDGCEDPTAAFVDATAFVYYTGWNQEQLRGSLMLATGLDAAHLRKQGPALVSAPQHVNPKEAEILRAPDGSWRLFFEFAHANASQIGVADSTGPSGPWNVRSPLLEARPGKWDSWHLSPGPVCRVGDELVMFYNGASRDAKWRIGWLTLDSDCLSVADRCDEPVVSPDKLTSGDTDIAFAASAVLEGNDIRLYYSIADRYMRRLRLTRA